MSGQSRLSSLMEVLFNTFVGLLIAMGATAVICWVHGIPMTWTNNFIITFWMTVVSIVRQYIIRRMWNAEFWKPWRNRNGVTRSE
jgi:membrane protein YdbS with pleckstrin-like domain